MNEWRLVGLWLFVSHCGDFFVLQIRIWDQASADEIKYGGELAPGNAGNRGKVDAYPRLLVPILQISDDINQIASLVRGDRGDWEKAREILGQSRYEKVAFKKIFNAYGDNIYYADPDRANVYLGGGATPKNEQSLAYLLRNEVLTNVENLQAELDYLMKPTTPASETTEDLLSYADTMKTTMDRYIEVVPPTELRKARELLAASP